MSILDGTTYWLEADGPDDPVPTLLRRIPREDGGVTDEAWAVRTREWRPTETFRRAAAKGPEGDFIEITGEQAAAAMAQLDARWRTRFARQGRPWPAGPTSERQ